MYNSDYISRLQLEDWKLSKHLIRRITKGIPSELNYYTYILGSRRIFKEYRYKKEDILAAISRELKRKMHEATRDQLLEVQNKIVSDPYLDSIYDDLLCWLKQKEVDDTLLLKAKDCYEEYIAASQKKPESSQFKIKKELLDALFASLFDYHEAKAKGLLQI